MRRTVTVAIAAALIGIGFVGGMGLGERRERGRDQTEGGEVESAAATPVVEQAQMPAATTQAPAAASQSTWPPLPAANAPIAEVFDELAERARRGDAAAACRLAADLQRCARALGQRELARNLQDQAARYEQTPAGMVDAIANIERRQEGVGERCDGLQPAQLTQAFDFQRQAALARPELRVWFALNPALERRDFVNELERWAEYRRLALPWLEAAAREGDLPALIALSRVHGDLRRNSPPFPPFRIDDPVRALAYHEVLLRRGVDYRGVRIGADTARARLDADGQARAAELASALPDPGPVPLDNAATQAAMDRTFEPTASALECEGRR